MKTLKYGQVNYPPKRITSNEITSTIVSGAKIICSILLFDFKFPTVLTKYKTVMIHKEMVIGRCGTAMPKQPAFANSTIVNSIVIIMDTVSNRYICLSDFILPPQTILYGTNFNRRAR